MANYTNAQIGLLIGTTAGVIAGSLLYSLTKDAIYFALLPLGLVIGYIYARMTATKARAKKSEMTRRKAKK